MYKTTYHFSMQKPYASLNLNNKFPQDIECIISSTHPDKGSLYISNIEAAENLKTLKKHRITAVMSCAKGYELRHPANEVPHYKYIPTIDKDDCDISCHFDQAVDFITNHIAHANVLVHCIAGVSRSVSMVLAYFIRQHKMQYQQAYNLVKSKRKIIHPNDGFIRQLKLYSESRLRTQNKQRDFSPTNKTSCLTSHKRNNYLQKNDLPHFKSVQLIEDSVKAKEDESMLSQYKSNQLTPKKLDNYHPATTKNSYYDTSKSFHKTTNSFLTPNKTKFVMSKDEVLQTYSQHPKTQNIDRYPPDDKILNAQNNNQNKQGKNTSPTKKVENIPHQTARKQQFQEMNRQLSEKIERIREKYQNQRKKLYQRYQGGDKTQETHGTHKKNSNTDNIYQHKGASQDRKVSLTVDRFRKQKDDYIKSPILREEKVTSQLRDRLKFGLYNDLEMGELYNKKFDNIYTVKNYKNEYKWQNRFDAARMDRIRGTDYNDYLRYNYDYSFKKY